MHSIQSASEIIKNDTYIYDLMYFIIYLMGQPTRPTQPSIPLGGK